MSLAAAQNPQSYGDAETSALVEIDCSLTPTFNGSVPENMPTFGSTFPDGNFTPGQFGNGDFNSGQFGDFGSFPTPGQESNGTMFGGGSFMRSGVSLMTESSYSDVSSISGVVVVAPILQVSETQNLTAPSNPQEQPNSFNAYMVMGVPLSSSIIDVCPVLPTNITAGRNLQAGDSGVVVLSERTSESLDAGIGATVTLFGQSFEVVGIYGASSGAMNSGAAYMSLSDAQSISDNTGKISSLRVFADSNVDVSSVVNEIKTLHPELSVVTGQEDFGATPFSSSSPQPVLSTSSPSPSAQEVDSSSSDFIYVAIAAVAVIMIVASLVLSRRRHGAKKHVEGSGFSVPNSGDANRSSFSYVSLLELKSRPLSVNRLTNCFCQSSKI